MFKIFRKIVGLDVHKRGSMRVSESQMRMVVQCISKLASLPLQKVSMN